MDHGVSSQDHGENIGKLDLDHYRRIPAARQASADRAGDLRCLGLVYDVSTLFYATGGLAVAHFSDSWGDQAAGPAFVISSGYTRTGWTAGGGVEHMFAPHWTGRVEALYADFGTATTTTAFAGQTYRTEFQHSVTLVRGALSYKW